VGQNRYTMKQIVFFILLSIFYSGYAQVIISEIQSSNSSTIADEWGDYDDWIELYNPGDLPVNIEGMVMKNNAHIWGIPLGDTSTLLYPGSYFLIWADHEESEGIFHANFGLSISESLIICEPDSSTVIDALIIPDLASDASYGRCPDGEWRIFDTPSPMEANHCESTVNLTIRTDGLLIYPGITRENILLKIPDNEEECKEIKLISTLGSILFEKSFFGVELTVSLERYPGGIYILLLSSGNAIYKEKIIKME